MQQPSQQALWYWAQPVSIEGHVVILDVQSALDFGGDIRDGYITVQGRRAMVTQSYPSSIYPSPFGCQWFLYRWLDS